MNIGDSERYHEGYEFARDQIQHPWVKHLTPAEIVNSLKRTAELQKEEDKFNAFDAGVEAYIEEWEKIHYGISDSDSEEGEEYE